MDPFQAKPSATTMTRCRRPSNSRASSVPGLSERVLATGGIGGGVARGLPVPAPLHPLPFDPGETAGCRAIEIAIGPGLELVGEKAQQQAAPHMLGRPVAQELAPPDPEFLQVEAAQRLEFQLERIAAPG